VAADLNEISAFLALSDDTDDGPTYADILVLLGNSVLATAEKAFSAMRAGVAPRLLIAGGRGHSTRFLEQSLHSIPRYQSILTGGRSEAEMLAEVATRCWSIAPERVLLETASTNCGENASFALRTIKAANVPAARAILMQDPTMQRRIDATFRKVWREAGRVAQFINDPTWTPRLVPCDGTLAFANPVAGCWTVARFASLVMGEIPRLCDNAAGYGPAGRGLIVHVDIPDAVLVAHARLAAAYPELVRAPWAGDAVLPPDGGVRPGC
jgi:uncharacterized SAM-binding protein YcdF (DUF218 family)